MDADIDSQKPTINWRSILDSSLIISGCLILIWVGNMEETIKILVKDQEVSKTEIKTLSGDLVQTQKEIIHRLTRIETKMDL